MPDKENNKSKEEVLEKENMDKYTVDENNEYESTSSSSSGEDDDGYPKKIFPLSKGEIVSDQEGTRKYTVVKYLGKGNFSRCWSALDPDGKLVAIKITKANPQYTIQAADESKILSKI